MIQLGYKKAVGSTAAYWFGKIDGQDFKFIRVVVGLSAPTMDRAQGCAILLGELYRPSGAPGYKALDAYVNDWPYLENWLVIQRKQTQFSYLIIDGAGDDPIDIFYQMHQLAHAIDEIPVLPLDAPKFANSEFSRQKVNQMIDDGRLNMDLVIHKLEKQQRDAAAALQAAVIWMDENKPVYKTKSGKPVTYKHLMGQL